MSFSSNKVRNNGLVGHWFFGPVIDQWRVYSQVIIASIFINFFALVSAFFVMTVYDRVIPNESLDTLLFLTIGVSVVILFDFLMKYRYFLPFFVSARLSLIPAELVESLAV